MMGGRGCGPVERGTNHRPPRPVEGIGGDHNGGPRFSDLATLSGVQIDAPDFAAAHWCSVWG